MMASRRRRSSDTASSIDGSTAKNTGEDSKVAWYRNSFGETIPAPAMPPEPVAMDPPLVLPPELRPLGGKRRYLRTMQLITEPLPEVARSAFDCDLRGRSSSRTSLTFEKTLRRQGSLSANSFLRSGKEKERSGRKLLKAISHADLGIPPPGTSERRASGSTAGLQQDDSIAEEHRLQGDQEDPEDETNAHPAVPVSIHVSVEERPTRSAPQLAPVVNASRRRQGSRGSNRELLKGEVTLHQRRSGRSRRLSQDEVQDVYNSQCYFGNTAKTRFFTQYKELYSRPYLFVDSRVVDGGEEVCPTVTSGDSDEEGANTESVCIPAYPSSAEMRKVDEELHPSLLQTSGSLLHFSGERHTQLPLRDKLSPRAHFLSSCVAKPQLAVPFLIRKCTTKVFDFSFQSLGDDFISAFAKSLVHDLPYVEEIIVRDNRLSDDGLNDLLQAVSQGSAMLKLLRLDISQNQIGPKSAQTLRSYVVSSHCTLEMLLVDNADIDDHECAAFMTAFEKNLSIKQLWMSRNCIGKSENLNVVQPDFTTGGEAIASMLRVNLVLVRLDLAWNYLRLESSIELANSIRENHTLVELKLSYNACADAGAMMFGEALRFNRTLEVLDLSYNSIGVKGAMVLANAIRTNRTLRSLQLNGNNLGREGGQLLMAALCENRNEAGCNIELHACNLGASIVSGSASVPVLSPSKSTPSGGGPGVPVAPTRNGDDFNAQELPVFDARSARVFNPHEPAGRYSLNMGEAYDKMIAMELVRLATTKKGCRFLRIEHKSASGKKLVTLVKKENLTVEQHKLAGAGAGSRRMDEDGEESNLETRGLDAIFGNVDRDNSGYIDQQELMSVLNQIGLFPHVDRLSSILDRCDYNASGYIEQGEFSAFLFHAVFQVIDDDQSGKIDADEVEEAFKMLGIDHYDEREIQDAIATYDITGDGEMEESEFVEFMKDLLLDRIKSQLLGVDGENSHTSAQNGTPLVSLLDASTQKPWVVPEDGQLEIDFLYDREAFATNDEAFRQGKISQAGLELLIRNITELASSKAEQNELFHVAIHDADIRFTAAQAFQVLDACHYLKPEDTKIEMIALMLPQMLTAKEAQVLVARSLTLMQRCRLKARMGSAYSVVLGNPTAHYAFDLSKPKDRIALNKLAEVAQSEKLFSKQRSGRADTSQHGNWENFRNEELDGHSIVLTNAFFHVLPRRGKLCFDYVSTTRPKRGTTPISDRRFDQLIEALQMDVVLPDALGALGPTRAQRARGIRSKQPTTAEEKDGDSDSDCEDGPSGATATAAAAAGGAAPLAAIARLGSSKRSQQQEQAEFWHKTRASILKRGWDFVVSHSYTFRLTGATKENVGLKMVQIEAAICDRWLSCDQAAKIIACMPTNFHARPETARILFSRLIDLNNFYRLYDAMTLAERQVCVHSLGWLNIMNPMAPERSYQLNLAVNDEREMTKVLVDLAIGEPGENWLNQSFANVKGEPGIPGWKLPVRWEKEDGKDGGVNRSGFLELEYYSGQDRGCAPVLPLRKALMKRVLCGTKLYCL